MPRLRMIDGESSLVPQIDCRISSPPARREEIFARLSRLDIAAEETRLLEPINKKDIERQLSTLEAYAESLAGLYKKEGYEVDDNGTRLNSERFEGEWRALPRFERDQTDQITIDNFSTLGGFINPQGQLKYTFGLSLLYRDGPNAPSALTFLYCHSNPSEKVCAILNGSQSDAAMAVHRLESTVRYSRSLARGAKMFSECRQDLVVGTGGYHLTLLDDESVQTPLMVPVSHGAKAFEVIMVQHIKSVQSQMQQAIATAEEGSEMEAFKGWEIRAIQLDTLNFHDLNESMADAQLDGGDVPYSVLW